VDDPVIVGVCQRRREIAQGFEGLGNAELTAVRKPILERLPVHERHRVVRHTVRDTGAENGEDARVLEMRSDLDLATETVQVDRPDEVLRQHLHHDPSAKRLLIGEKHLGHATTPELTLEGVGVAERRLESISDGHCMAGRQPELTTWPPLRVRGGRLARWGSTNA
jgi:hypothetical protein